jgi:mono/diheme cytochrome c family protein
MGRCDLRRTLTALATVLALAALFGLATGDQAAKLNEGGKGQAKVVAAKGVFTKYKCRSCHSIEAQGITKKAVEGEEEEAAKGQKPPDLSGVGLERKADWIVLFLQKKEKIEGRLHGKKFRGTDEELKELATWLETLKEESAAKKMKAGEKAGAAGTETKTVTKTVTKSGE